MTNFNERTEKYTSHTLFSKVLRKGCERVDVGYVWESSWRRRQTATYWPKLLSATILAWLLNRGSLRAQVLSLELVLTRGHPISNCNWNWIGTDWDPNWLTQTDFPKPSVAPGYIIVWHPPASWGHTHLHRIQPCPQVKVIFQHPRLDAPVLPFFCLFT